MPQCTLSELTALDVVCVSIHLCGHYVVNWETIGEERERHGKLYSIYSVVTVLCAKRSED